MNLSNDAILRAAPAAFATSAHVEMSDVYAHVTTINVVDALRQDGWVVTGAKQARSRLPGSVEHNRHEIVLTHPELPTHREGSPQMYLGNSGDGSSAFRTIGGFLRAACLNQNYVGIKAVGGVFHHRGGSLEDRIVAGARHLRANFDRVLSRYDLWAQIEMSPEQQAAFAAAAVALRWPSNGPKTVNLASPRNGLLRARRLADVGQNTLWGTYNRVQESLVRGGFTANFDIKNEAGEVIGSTVRRIRKITGLSCSERINTGLWDLAERNANEQLGANSLAA